MAALYQIKESVLFERKSYSEIFVKAKVNYYLANMIEIKPVEVNQLRAKDDVLVSEQNLRQPSPNHISPNE